MKKQIYKVLSLIILSGFFTSCLKDDSLILDPAKGHNVIEFANPGQIITNGTVYPLYVFSYDLVAENPTVTLPVKVSYSGPEAGAPEDITVNIGVGTDAQVQEYNEEGNQDAELTLMPEENYTISATSLVIKKGQSKAEFSITFDLSKFDLAKALTLPLNITSVSSGIISGNFKTILLNVGAKNRIDGLYHYTTTSTTSLRPNTDHNDVPLVTTGPNTVTTNLFDYYANIITYSIDPVTNKVTVLGGLGTPSTDPISSYDPATKVMHVVWSAGSYHIDETFTYTGSR